MDSVAPTTQKNTTREEDWGQDCRRMKLRQLNLSVFFSCTCFVWGGCLWAQARVQITRENQADISVPLLSPGGKCSHGTASEIAGILRIDMPATSTQSQYNRMSSCVGIHILSSNSGRKGSGSLTMYESQKFFKENAWYYTASPKVCSVCMDSEAEQIWKGLWGRVKVGEPHQCIKSFGSYCRENSRLYWVKFIVSHVGCRKVVLWTHSGPVGWKYGRLWAKNK